MKFVTLKSFFIFLIVPFSFYSGISQTIIKGIVTTKNNDPLSGVNIMVKENNEGTSTDINGNYKLKVNNLDTLVLIFSMMGYEPFQKQIIIHKGDIILNVILKEKQIELNVVNISIGSYQAVSSKKLVTLKPQDIVKATGAMGDLSSALSILPGAQQTGVEEGLFVRGGANFEAKTLIDGIIAPNPYFSSIPDISQKSRYLPFLFNDINFSTGGYSAQYGQALSSVLLLDLRQMPDTTYNILRINNNNLLYSHFHRWDKFAIGISGNYTNQVFNYAINKQYPDWNGYPSSIGSDIILYYKTSKTGLLKTYFNYTQSFSSLNKPDPKTNFVDNYLYEVTNKNIFTNINYKEILSPKLLWYSAFSFSFNDDEIINDTIPLTKRNNIFQGRATITYFLGELSKLRIGGELNNSQYKSLQNTLQVDRKGFYWAPYVESDIYLSHRLVLRAGLRIENSDIVYNSNLAPRASLSYKTGKFSQFAFSYGDFYQVPEENDLLYSNFDLHKLEYEKSSHFILNFEHITDSLIIRCELYYKNYADLLKTETNVLSNNGSGFAQGIDVFIRDKKTLKNIEYWISYSYLDTERVFMDYPYEVTPSFAATHSLYLVFRYYIKKLRSYPGLTYNYTTGRPYYNPNNAQFLSDLTPDYQDLSLNFIFEPKLFKNSQTTIMLNFGNILGLDHTYSYSYSADGTTRIPLMGSSLRNTSILFRVIF
jgi:hypothetical protein